MGYTTEFEGTLKFSKPLTNAQVLYIQKFCETRRVKFDSVIVGRIQDDERIAVCLPIGVDGEFFVGETEYIGHGQYLGVLSYNESPSTQPGLWCQWTVSDDGTELMWDGGEKFYYYVEWLQYLISNFYTPWGVRLNGKIIWQGESEEDIGTIIVIDSVIDVRSGVVVK